MPYGMAALGEALKGVDFPISRQDLINQVGDRQVEIEKGRSMMMREFLGACSHNIYNTVTDVTTCPEIEQKMKAA
ncbi:MAG: hypothetical protein M1335_06455 [Chloroflexi bacterium]|nr:hypothetical protein [Chloroflexota bacterium]